MSFERESQLCQVLTANVFPTFGVSGAAAVLNEVQVGTVIPDIVLVCGPERPWTTQMTGFDSCIVADLLRTRVRRADTLSRRLFARPETTTRALDRLERLGVLARASKTTYALRQDCFPKDSQVIAIEAKLERWRDAIEQAAEYLRFANSAYVALPDDVIDRTPAIPLACGKRGLGVIAVSRDGAQIRRQAPLQRTFSAAWVWLVARALAHDAASARQPRPGRSATRAGDRELSADENLLALRS